MPSKAASIWRKHIELESFFSSVILPEWKFSLQKVSNNCFGRQNNRTEVWRVNITFQAGALNELKPRSFLSTREYRQRAENLPLHSRPHFSQRMWVMIQRGLFLCLYLVSFFRCSENPIQDSTPTPSSYALMWGLEVTVLKCFRSTVCRSFPHNYSLIHLCLAIYKDIFIYSLWLKKINKYQCTLTVF